MNAKKIALIAGVIVLLGAIVGFTVNQSQKNVVAVQTGKVVKQDISSVVTASGEIRPETYVNIGANAMGRITHLYVQEGDKVKKGQVLAQLENIQSAADVNAMKAQLASNETDSVAAQAALNTAIAQSKSSSADLARAKLDYDRAQDLYKDQLIAKQDFDSKKAAYDMAVATLAQREASLAQAMAQTQSQRAHVNQVEASQRSNYDALDKTISRAPFDGLVTNVPVREGETVVVGIQNAEGSTLMTLADMSVITAEVKVDETDIVNVSLNQPVDVTVDALPGRVFKGHVSEVGDQALLRTTGIATSQSTTGTEEAKDFKVVVTLDSPSDDLRPGLSATARITTANIPNALTIPIQALVQRDVATEKALEKNNGKPPTSVVNASSGDPSKPKFVQGVYVLREEHKRLRVVFVPVTTGISGATDIQVLNGLKAGDEIVTGRYKVLRTLKSGTVVKRDNTPEVASATDNS